jgi:hypothetical protein
MDCGLELELLDDQRDISGDFYYTYLQDMVDPNPALDLHCLSNHRCSTVKKGFLMLLRVFPWKVRQVGWNVL